MLPVDQHRNELAEANDAINNHSVANLARKPTVAHSCRGIAAAKSACTGVLEVVGLDFRRVLHAFATTSLVPLEEQQRPHLLEQQHLRMRMALLPAGRRGARCRSRGKRP